MLTTVLTIAQVVVALALIVVVLLQHGKQQGLSGAIAGGAETFFGKNKGRTVDVMLKKFTSVVAILFIALSLALTFVASKQNGADESTETEATDTADTSGEVTSIPVQIDDERIVTMNMDNTYTATDGSALTMNDNGDFVLEDGTVYVTSEEFSEGLNAMGATEAETDVTDESTDVVDESSAEDTADEDAAPVEEDTAE